MQIPLKWWYGYSVYTVWALRSHWDTRRHCLLTTLYQVSGLDSKGHGTMALAKPWQARIGLISTRLRQCPENAGNIIPIKQNKRTDDIGTGIPFGRNLQSTNNFLLFTKISTDFFTIYNQILNHISFINHFKSEINQYQSKLLDLFSENSQS